MTALQRVIRLSVESCGRAIILNMLRPILAGYFCIVVSLAVTAQQRVEKLIETEQAFAKTAADTNTRDAFLAYMADTAVVFQPDLIQAKPYWTARKANASLLSWAPNFADISSNGVMGYTTGNWEWRENRTGGAPAAFGDFITVWLRQSGGGYKWVVDIGVTNDKPAAYSTDWKTAASTPVGKDGPMGDFATAFYQLAVARGVVKAYETFADENIRSYREGKMAILGKKAALAELKSDKSEIAFSKLSSTLAAADMGYILNTYKRSKDGKQVEKGNYLQIWKFYGGRWHIVLDIFKPVPA
jgi:ketosteroid isomerase-like protein